MYFFLKGVNVCDLPSEEEKDYLLRVAELLVAYQKATITSEEEIAYFKNLEKNTETSSRRELLKELGLENSIVFENPDYDDAIVGYDESSSRIIYDVEKMAKHLMNKEGMTYEDAVDFISYNTLRALPYVEGDGPIVMRSIEEYLK